jgi:hypothetical protein
MDVRSGTRLQWVLHRHLVTAQRRASVTDVKADDLGGSVQLCLEPFRKIG